MGAVVHVVGGVEVRHRGEDSYVHATAMCKQFGASWTQFRMNLRTQRFVEALSSNVGIPTLDLVQSRRGSGGGTWIHPDLAVELAAWLSPEFGVQMAQWVRKLMTTGRVELPSAPPRPSAPSGFAEVSADMSDPVEAQTASLIHALKTSLETHRRQVALERQQAALAVQQAETRAVADAALARVEEVRGAQADTHALAVGASNAARAVRDEVHGFHGYATVLAFFGRQGWELSLDDAKKWGKLMSRTCRDRGVPIRSIKHEAYPSVNVYPESVFREVFSRRLAAQDSWGDV